MGLSFRCEELDLVDFDAKNTDNNSVPKYFYDDEQEETPIL